MTTPENNFIDPDDLNNNTSNNQHLSDVVNQRVSRRNMLKSLGTASLALFGGSALAGCAGSGDTPPPAPVTPTPVVPTPVIPTPEKLLSFTPVNKSVADVLSVPKGYTARVIYALGDPLKATTSEFNNDGNDTDWENRAGDHHDGMEWFGLNNAGQYDPTSLTRGLLVMNHEATTDEKLSSFFIHANGGTSTLPRPASEVDKELAVHGLSLVEVRRTNNVWAYDKASPFNRRFTQNTEVEIAGPLKGHDLVKTKYSPDGTISRGTLNNCGTGKTPWGSFVSGEENWSGYFTRTATDDTARGNDKSVTSLKRYGKTAGSTSRHGWESVTTKEDRFIRWDISVKGATPADDYRNEINTMGYIVEVDPLNANKKLKKRTALGRFAHESAAFSKPIVGRKLAIYQGDDSRNEYIYKFVTDAVWSASDANSSDVLATGDKFLDKGKLFVAKINADGTGTWIELSMANPLIANYAGYKFADEADIAMNSRLAGDAVGATKMDRPEWCAVHPVTGEVYFTLTNNSTRTLANVDAPNPRAYEEMKGTLVQKGNVNGHILRIREAVGGSSAVNFTWDIYLFGAESTANKATVNISNLTDDQDFSSPDGLAFSPSTGICWIQTDDGGYTDVTNCMMLAAIPGTVGDGDPTKIGNVTTYVGEKPMPDQLKRFLVGPKDCEITGLCETPDGKAMFINIQHPGEGTKQANIADPTKYTSQWPSNAGYGKGKRPRSATIVITKDDGGRIGS